MASTAHLASHRQTLYFASLHCQHLAEGGPTIAEPLQHRQCLLEAATECLYRSSVFLVNHLLEQSAAPTVPTIAGSQAFANWLAEAHSTAHQDPALARLASAFSAPNPLADLPGAYAALWSPATATHRPADHLRLVDTTVSLERCVEWHDLLEGLAAECIAMQSEY